MFGFLRPKPITKHIHMYIAWKAVRFPFVAGTHERVLVAFFNKMKIRSLGEITPSHLREYCGRFPAQYQKNQFIHVIRQFSRYWRRMGLLSHEFADFMGEDTILDITEDISPTMHTEQVRRVRKMRKDGLSLKQIVLRMETDDRKKYHLKQIHRWSKYVLPGDGVVQKLSTP